MSIWPVLNTWNYLQLDSWTVNIAIICLSGTHDRVLIGQSEDVTMKDLVFEHALKSAVTGQQHTTCYQFTLQLQLTKHRNTTTVNDTRKCYRRYRYFLPKLSAIPILFVVVICTHIFIISPFLVTKTIFSNECHTQQSNLKICKVCYKFQTMEVPCNYSSL